MMPRASRQSFFRRNMAWLIAAVVAAAGVVVFFAWPRGPVYADYVDGVRPTVVFVWSDPTPHHPYG